MLKNKYKPNNPRWERFNFSLKSKIDEILEKEEFTFEELLDEEDLLQECRYGNKSLVEYLSKPEIVKKTLQYLLVEATGENVSEKVKFKYPYLANEIIGLELFGIVEVISSDTELLDFIFAFLNNKNSLNSVYSGYFSRCVGIQLRKRWEETLKYLQQHPDIIDKLCSHLETASIKDVVLHLLVGCEDMNLLEETTNFLISTKLIPKLINLFVTGESEILHDNITRCILDFIFNEGKNTILLKEFESFDIVSKLVKCVIDSSTGNSEMVKNALSIIIELLIIIKENNSLTINEEPHPLLKLIFEKFIEFAKILDSPTNSKSIELSFGNVQVPVGHSRLKVIQFFQVLYFVAPEKIENPFCELGILKKILDLFFQYKWNSFLHISIRDLINSILEGSSNKLIDEIILNYKIIPKMMAICDQYEDSKTKQEFRRGNFNHIFQICNKIVQTSEKNTYLNEKCLTFENWDKFVVDFLTQINQVRSQKIGELKNDFKLLYEDYDSQNLDDNDNDFFDDDSDDSDDDFDIFNNFDDEVIVKDGGDGETPSWLAENDSFDIDNNFILRNSGNGPNFNNKDFNEFNDSSDSSTEESTEEEVEEEVEGEVEGEVEDEGEDKMEEKEVAVERVEEKEKEKIEQEEEIHENNDEHEDQNKINNIEIEENKKIEQEENTSQNISEPEELEMKSPKPKTKLSSGNGKEISQN
ncbi:serine/threonine-protein phosphatase 6 regulatory subunit [Anaeramoeba flamelloides]|uniref:Serine/threonine-protein phosphatase 6 regulatory subunit n=1 Tax=Anaeramoeba flamelloides TaxID=1746091 RepID=A0AAV7YU99_9EUKA|nr:serine/threonine-protein phosphatase 6 regulatory subunit [Anaeramoeba flamelloides]